MRLAVLIPDKMFFPPRVMVGAGRRRREGSRLLELVLVVSLSFFLMCLIEEVYYLLGE